MLSNGYKTASGKISNGLTPSMTRMVDLALKITSMLPLLVRGAGKDSIATTRKMISCS